MRDSIKLSIPQPCAERWENFTVTPHGGFCSSCSRTVVDFTTMSDEQVLAYFKATKEHTCGRFRGDQLKSYTITRSQTEVRPGLTLLRAGFLGLLLLLGGQYVSAQTGTKTPVPTEQRFETGKVAVNDGVTVKGVIHDPDGNAMPGVNVVHKGTSDGTVTDANGYFEFPKKLHAGDQLVISFIGYATVERIVEPGDGNVDLALAFDLNMIVEPIVMGAVSQDAPYEEQRGLRKVWKNIKSIF